MINNTKTIGRNNNQKATSIFNNTRQQLGRDVHHPQMKMITKKHPPPIEDNNKKMVMLTNRKLTCSQVTG
jgi:hypothetical protein